MRWAYGVTTVPARVCDLLPRTLSSLERAGFNTPRLFVDGATKGFEHFKLPISYRDTNVRTFMNWYLGLLELYGREPTAERYAMFQDDFVTSLYLREYLERSPWPGDGYLNLYTFPCNQVRCTGEGWFESDQLGKGAVALVFTNEGARKLLSHEHMINRPMDPIRGWRAIDGGIVDAHRKMGWKEYIHNPSLVQHTGDISSMGNSKHQLAASFRGESFDLRTLLNAR